MRRGHRDQQRRPAFREIRAAVGAIVAARFQVDAEARGRPASREHCRRRKDRLGTALARAAGVERQQGGRSLRGGRQRRDVRPRGLLGRARSGNAERGCAADRRNAKTEREEPPSHGSSQSPSLHERSCTPQRARSCEGPEPSELLPFHGRHIANVSPGSHHGPDPFAADHTSRYACECDLGHEIAIQSTQECVWLEQNPQPELGLRAQPADTMKCGDSLRRWLPVRASRPRRAWEAPPVRPPRRGSPCPRGFRTDP